MAGELPESDVSEMTLQSDRAPSSARAADRLLVALLVGTLAAMWVRAHALSEPTFTSDFDQVWAAARAMLAGDDPYAAVGPSAPFKWKWPFYYPLPALLVTAPLGALPVIWARILFVGIGVTAFTFAILRDGWGRWPILLSVTFYVSIDLVQWSLLLAAAYWIPGIAFMVACKPNFALPIVAGARDSRTWQWLMIGSFLLVAASFAIRPTWGADWLANVREAPHFIPPLFRRGGFLVLLALLRWRRPEARWLLALAATPQAPSFYDPLLLIAVCSRWWESAILTAGTYALFFYVGANTPQPDYLSWGKLVGDATIWSCYLPMLALVLLRPNEGRFELFAGPLRRWSRAVDAEGAR